MNDDLSILDDDGLDDLLDAFKSSEKSLFITDTNVDISDIGTTYNVVQANGMFHRQWVGFGWVNLKVGDCAFPHLKNKIYSTIEWAIPKVPLHMFYQILSWFKIVYLKHKTEAYIRVYFDKETNKFFFHIPHQEISACLVETDFSTEKNNIIREYDTNPRYALVLQVHSHHTMGGKFSGIDDADQKTLTGIHVVIGTIFENPSYQMRVALGNIKNNVEFSDVFDTYSVTGNEDWLAGWEEKLQRPKPKYSTVPYSANKVWNGSRYGEYGYSDYDSHYYSGYRPKEYAKVSPDAESVYDEDYFSKEKQLSYRENETLTRFLK